MPCRFESEMASRSWPAIIGVIKSLMRIQIPTKSSTDQPRLLFDAQQPRAAKPINS